MEKQSTVKRTIRIKEEKKTKEAGPESKLNVKTSNPDQIREYRKAFFQIAISRYRGAFCRPVDKLKTETAYQRIMSIFTDNIEKEKEKAAEARQKICDILAALQQDLPINEYDLSLHLENFIKAEDLAQLDKEIHDLLTNQILKGLTWINFVKDDLRPISRLPDEIKSVHSELHSYVEAQIKGKKSKKNQKHSLPPEFSFGHPVLNVRLYTMKHIIEFYGVLLDNIKEIIVDGDKNLLYEKILKQFIENAQAEEMKKKSDVDLQEALIRPSICAFSFQMNSILREKLLVEPSEHSADNIEFICRLMFAINSTLCHQQDPKLFDSKKSFQDTLNNEYLKGFLAGYIMEYLRLASSCGSNPTTAPDSNPDEEQKSTYDHGIHRGKEEAFNSFQSDLKKFKIYFENKAFKKHQLGFQSLKRKEIEDKISQILALQHPTLNHEGESSSQNKPSKKAEKTKKDRCDKETSKPTDSDTQSKTPEQTDKGAETELQEKETEKSLQGAETNPSKKQLSSPPLSPKRAEAMLNRRAGSFRNLIRKHAKKTASDESDKSPSSSSSSRSSSRSGSSIIVDSPASLSPRASQSTVTPVTLVETRVDNSIIVDSPASLSPCVSQSTAPPVTLIETQVDNSSHHPDDEEKVLTPRGKEKYKEKFTPLYEKATRSNEKLKQLVERHSSSSSEAEGECKETPASKSSKDSSNTSSHKSKHKKKR